LVLLALASDDSLADYARSYPSLARLIEFLDSFDEWFPIVTRPARALAGRDRQSAQQQTCRRSTRARPTSISGERAGTTGRVG
jgi:hypothetical protein